MTGATNGAAHDEENRLARVALTWLAEPGNRAVWVMVRTTGAEATLKRLLRGDIPDAALRASVSARVTAGDPRQVALAALQRSERLGARLVVPDDPEWPTSVDSLRTLDPYGTDRVNHDTMPPLCLWLRGPWSLHEVLQRSVAMVGSRAATPYGLHVTADIAFGLAEREWTVVSGGAFGIDAAAHRAALTAGGPTVAVLACGVDRPYPMGNAALFDRIAEQGLLVSEWPPGAEPLRHRFLIRNRVIAAATAGTVLVEAAARSGARQTMARVLALGRRAMVVPGPVTSAMSVGCHELLRQYETARVVTGLPHVLEEVGRIGYDLAPVPRGPEHPRDSLDEESALVLEAVPRRGTVGPEQLAARAGVALRVVLRRLGALEAAGLIVRRSNGYALASRRPTTNEGRRAGSARPRSPDRPDRAADTATTVDR